MTLIPENKFKGYKSKLIPLVTSPDTSLTNVEAEIDKFINSQYAKRVPVLLSAVSNPRNGTYVVVICEEYTKE